jgi:hypothetical protein
MAATLLAAMVLSLSTSQANAAKPAPAADEARIESLVIIGKQVLASTRQGVFRAAVDEKRWEPIKFPDRGNMPVIFEERDGTDDAVYGFVPRVYYPPDHSGEIRPKKPGLYRSIDCGNTWSYLGDAKPYRRLFHVDKDLYAIVENSYINGTVMVSHDRGATWGDLTNRESRACTVFRDPDHPGLVCLIQEGIRAMYLQADDASYKWKEYRSPHWFERQPPEVQFEPDANFGISLGYFYNVWATLGNYFNLSFGVRTSLAGFQLKQDRQEYSFARSSDKRIKVTLTFIDPKQKSILVENRVAPDFWSASLLTPDRKISFRSKKWLTEVKYDRLDQRGRLATGTKYRQSHVLSPITMKEGDHYDRELDLDELGDFNQIGSYRVYITYSNSWIAETNIFKPAEVNEFLGFVVSKTFTVKVTE